jgi:hypothetical protein
MSKRDEFTLRNPETSSVRGLGTGRWKNWIDRCTAAEIALTISTVIPSSFDRRADRNL